MKKVEETKIPSPTVQSIKPRRKFDSGFKLDAVALWLGSGKSAREIRAELGITEKHLHTWHKKHAPATPVQQTEMESELVALRGEKRSPKSRKSFDPKLL